MNDDALTRRVLACCYTVHRELGPGYLKSTYQGAITRELERAGLPFKRQESFPVLYQGEEIDRVQVDFVVDNKMILEVAAKSGLDKQDAAWGHACLKASGLPRGLLINFGEAELQIKRLTAVPRSSAQTENSGFLHE
ncbi:MAG TPA: GxxExxY protein [Chthonomonadaceae bacterium]|nr:GxxExxY protein [Chthonomonadaceae bacterium]